MVLLSPFASLCGFNDILLPSVPSLLLYSLLLLVSLCSCFTFPSLDGPPLQRLVADFAAVNEWQCCTPALLSVLVVPLLSAFLSALAPLLPHSFSFPSPVSFLLAPFALVPLLPCFVLVDFHSVFSQVLEQWSVVQYSLDL